MDYFEEVNKTIDNMYDKELNSMLDEIIKKMTIKGLNINEDVYDLASKFPYPYECVHRVYCNNGCDIDKTEKELENIIRTGRW